jgi:hypothetical protein
MNLENIKIKDNNSYVSVFPLSVNLGGTGTSSTNNALSNITDNALSLYDDDYKSLRVDNNLDVEGNIIGAKDIVLTGSNNTITTSTLYFTNNVKYLGGKNIELTSDTLTIESMVSGEPDTMILLQKWYDNCKAYIRFSYQKDYAELIPNWDDISETLMSLCLNMYDSSGTKTGSFYFNKNGGFSTTTGNFSSAVYSPRFASTLADDTSLRMTRTMSDSTVITGNVGINAYKGVFMANYVDGTQKNWIEISPTQSYTPNDISCGGGLTVAQPSSGTYIVGKTGDASININGTFNTDNKSYQPIIKGTYSDGVTWNFGGGADGTLGFYAYDSSTTSGFSRRIVWKPSTGTFYPSDGNPLGDYVIAQGYTNCWRWAKYKNGFLHMWYIDLLTSKVNTAWGSGNSSYLGTFRTISYPTFPVAFSDVTQMGIAVTPASYGGWGDGAWCMLVGGLSNTTMPQYCLVRTASLDNNATWTVLINVWGFWKSM